MSEREEFLWRVGFRMMWATKHLHEPLGVWACANYHMVIVSPDYKLKKDRKKMSFLFPIFLGFINLLILEWNPFFLPLCVRGHSQSFWVKLQSGTMMVERWWLLLTYIVSPLCLCKNAFLRLFIFWLRNNMLFPLIHGCLVYNVNVIGRNLYNYILVECQHYCAKYRKGLNVLRYYVD